MSYELTLSIAEDSPEGQNIERVAEVEHVSREEAARKLLGSLKHKNAASPAARRILGAFREDADLMDEVMELVMSERERRAAACAILDSHICRRVLFELLNWRTPM